MTRAQLIVLARAPLGRVVVASVGLVAVAFLLHATGVRRVWGSLTRAAPYVPVILLCEAAILGCDTLSLRRLYGPDRRRLPATALARVALIGYAVTGLVPGGRPVAEGVKATLLAGLTSAARAATAAARFQGVLLLANATISLVCTLAAYALVGASVVTAAIAFNTALTFSLGAAVLLAGRHLHVGAWLARRSEHARNFGPEFDQLLRTEPAVPWCALGYATLSRVVQVTEYGLLLRALGARPTVPRSLLAEGVNLVGALVGDLIPAQLGAIEAAFTFSDRALGLSRSDALAMPLLAHTAQLFWVVVGLLVPLVWPATVWPATPREPTPAPEHPREAHTP
jgi:hypothetical protein